MTVSKENSFLLENTPRHTLDIPSGTPRAIDVALSLSLADAVYSLL